MRESSKNRGTNLRFERVFGRAISSSDRCIEIELREGAKKGTRERNRALRANLDTFWSDVPGGQDAEGAPPVPAFQARGSFERVWVVLLKRGGNWMSVEGRVVHSCSGTFCD